MTRDELITITQQELKGLAVQFEEADFYNAVSTAERETGWTCPESNITKIHWLKERTKRHLFFMMLSVSAHKFKFKQYNLQNRFEHYRLLVKDMDEAWAVFLAEDLLLLEGAGAFSTKVDAGFAYDEIGNDVTYRPENIMKITPSESDG
jgi:hypothetical protein